MEENPVSLLCVKFLIDFADKDNIAFMHAHNNTKLGGILINY